MGSATCPRATRTPSARSRSACSASCPGTSRPAAVTTRCHGTPVGAARHHPADRARAVRLPDPARPPGRSSPPARAGSGARPRSTRRSNGVAGVDHPEADRDAVVPRVSHRRPIRRTSRDRIRRRERAGPVLPLTTLVLRAPPPDRVLLPSGGRWRRPAHAQVLPPPARVRRRRRRARAERPQVVRGRRAAAGRDPRRDDRPPHPLPRAALVVSRRRPARRARRCAGRRCTPATPTSARSSPTRRCRGRRPPSRPPCGSCAGAASTRS